MKDFNYENNVVPKHFYFYDKVIVPELFTKNIKTERTCKKLQEDRYCDTCGKVRNHKKVLKLGLK